MLTLVQREGTVCHGVGSVRQEPWKAVAQQHRGMNAHVQLCFVFRLDPEWTLNGVPSRRVSLHTSMNSV